MESVPILLWVIVGVMAVMSAVLLSGRGSGLIAGYNTASAEEKAKYAEKRLCRVMGGGLSVITITTAVSLWYNFDFPADYMKYIVFGIILVTVLLMLILENTVCKSK